MRFSTSPGLRERAGRYVERMRTPEVDEETDMSTLEGPQRSRIQHDPPRRGRAFLAVLPRRSLRPVSPALSNAAFDSSSARRISSSLAPLS
jgi:hypothetical protein